ncbi:MAG: protein kinase [Myxococcaceae bacterium]|nr:protein kinase [Myxococcaceae bacterium]
MKKPIVFGKYLLLERVNVGGMAEVFIAKAFGVEGFERILAIKKILPTMAEDVEFITMFIDEARISVQLNHANIVHIHELGKHDDAYFIAMEYVSGRDLRTLLERYRRRKEVMPTAQAVLIASKLCEGLDYAHRKKDARGQDLGIIHRDVSPQNILVSYEGEVKIIDFGIAKAANRSQKTQAGILKGKFGYMSPEQVRGLPIDRRSDIFAVGVMLYEMLTGEKLFVGESDFSTLEKVRDADVPPPSKYNPNIPRGLENVVMKALARETSDRYQWASDLQEDLMRFLLSGEAIYSAKHLAAFMKEAFAEDLLREGDKMERFATIERPPNIESTGLTAKLDRPKFRRSGLTPPPVPVSSEKSSLAADTVPGRGSDVDATSDKTQIVESGRPEYDLETAISRSRNNPTDGLGNDSTLEALDVSGLHPTPSRPQDDELGKGGASPTASQRAPGNTPKPKIIIGANTGYSGETMIRPNLTREDVPVVAAEGVATRIAETPAAERSRPAFREMPDLEEPDTDGGTRSMPHTTNDLGPEEPTQGAGFAAPRPRLRSSSGPDKKTLTRLIIALSIVVALLLVIGTWLKLTAPAQLVVLVEPKGPFSLSINGKLYEGNSAVVLKPGDYDIEVMPRQEGFQRDKQHLTLSSGERVHKVTLKPIKPAVLVRPSDPEPSLPAAPTPSVFAVKFICEEQGVEVFIDGKSIGRTPNARAEGLAMDRRHQIQASKKGFQVMNLEVLNVDRKALIEQVLVMVPEGGPELKPASRPPRPDPEPTPRPKPRAEPKTVVRTEPKPEPKAEPKPEPVAVKAKGKFACSTKPPGAEVIINGKPTGQNTPIALSNALELPVGKHKVTFKLDGKTAGPFEINVTQNNIEKLVGVELP